MGRDIRKRPKRLSEKLLHIRQMLGLSQNEIIDHLGFKGRLDRETISNYERDRREPETMVVLAYARAAGVWADVLIDDDLHLPNNIKIQLFSSDNDQPPHARIANVILQLEIQSKSNSARIENNLRKNIETLYLKKFTMIKNGDHDYELEIPYLDNHDLNRIVVIEILQNISNEAYKHECSVKWDAIEKSSSRHW